MWYFFAEEEEKEEEEQQQQQQDKESPTKKSRVGKKTKLPKAILSSRGDKKKQFKYLCYQNRTRRVHDILIEILGDCVDKKALENDGFDYLIGNQDVAKDALAFIEMLQLRLQFQMKMKLSDLDNTDSFQVHNKENENNTSFDQKALDEFSKTLYFTCPINKQRKIVKALKTAVPELSGNIKY